VVNETFLSLGRGTTDIGSPGIAYSVRCSLIRDNTTNTNGLAALQVRVTKGDITSRTCTATVHDRYGSSLKSVARSVSGSGVKTFDWTNTLNTSSGSGAYYTVSCSMGGNDFIKSLYWDEPAPAAGSDAKIMPGNLCKTSGYAPMVRNPEYVTSGAGPFGGTFVECGPLRDTFSFFSTLVGLKVRLYAGTTTTDCQGIIGDGHDGYLLAVDKAATAVGNTTFDYGTSLNGWAFGAQYGLECWLTPSDKIYSVEWAE
jgi:hypothetical protein